MRLTVRNIIRSEPLSRDKYEGCMIDVICGFEVALFEKQTFVRLTLFPIFRRAFIIFVSQNVLYFRIFIYLDLIMLMCNL